MLNKTAIALTLIFSIFVSTARADNIEQLGAKLIPPDLLAAQIKALRGSALAANFLQMLNLSFIPPKVAKNGRYSDKEIKEILTEFDQIVDWTVSPVNQAIYSQHEKLNSLYKKYLSNQESRWKGLVSNEASSTWLAANNDFQVQAVPLSYLHEVLWVLASDKVPYQFLNFPEEYKKLGGRVYGLQRYNISKVLENQNVSMLLPNKFDMGKLRHIETETRIDGLKTLAKVGYYNGIDGLDYVVMLIYAELMDEATRAVQPRYQEALVRLRQLAEKHK